MNYSINVKYWNDGHDHELFFYHKVDAYHVFKALTFVAPNDLNDIEFVSLWDEKNRELLECIRF